MLDSGVLFPPAHSGSLTASQTNLRAAISSSSKSSFRRMLPSLTVLENIVWYFQFLALLLATRVSWPDQWRNAIAWMGAFLLDQRLGIPNIGRIDFRAHFMILGCAVPIFLSFVVLLSYRTLWIVLWYALLLVSVVLVIVGVSVRLLPGNPTFYNPGPSTVFFISGAVLLGLCIIAALAYKYQKRQRQIREMFDDMVDEEEEVDDGEMPDDPKARQEWISKREIRERERDQRAWQRARELQSNKVREMMESDSDESDDVEKGGAGAAGRSKSKKAGNNNSSSQPGMKRSDTSFRTLDKSMRPLVSLLDGDSSLKDEDPLEPSPWYQVVGYFLIVSGLIACCSVALAAIKRNSDFTANLTGPLRDAGIALCIIGICVGIVSLGFLIASLFPTGRIFLYRARLWWEDKFTILLLGFVSFMYIPTLNTLLAAWSCHPIDCPAGYVYPDKDLRLDTSSVSTLSFTSQTCVPCNILDACPSSLATALCTSNSDERSRLFIDPSLSCKRHIWYYFTPPSVLMVFGFSLGLFLFYSKLIQFSFRKICALDTKEIPYFRNPAQSPAMDDATPEQRAEIERRSNVTKFSTTVGIFHAKSGHIFRNVSYSYRYMILVHLVESFICVCFSVFIRNSLVSLCLMGALHAVHFIFHCYSRYYVSPVNNGLAIALRLNLIMDAYFSVAMERGANISRGIVILVIFLNCLIPVIGVLIGWLSLQNLNKFLDRCVAGDENAIHSIFKDRRKTVIVTRTLIRMLLINRRMELNDKRVEEARTIMAQERARRAAELEEYEVTEKQKEDSLAKLPSLMHKDIIGNRALIPMALEEASKRIQDPLLDAVTLIDERITRYTETVLAAFFMGIALLSAVCVAFVLVGIVRSSSTNLFIPHNPVFLSTSSSFISDHDFANYGDWNTFLANCCCTDGGTTLKYDKVEHWRCLNSYIKMKARSATLAGSDIDLYGGREHSGLALRPFCSRNFAPGVCREPFYQIPDKTLPAAMREEFNFYQQGVCTPSNYTITEPISEYSFQRLW